VPADREQRQRKERGAARMRLEGAQRIGAGDLDRQIDVRTGDELEGLADQFNRMTAQLRESYAGLERKVDERTRELQNSLEQQTAISEILRVISSSPTDVEPVLNAVAERAAHLCDAPFARILLIEGGELRPAAEYSWKPVAESASVPIDRTSVTGRAVTDLKTVHFADIAPIIDTEFPGAKRNFERLGMRTVLAVPLMREGGAYGAIFLYRTEPRMFSPDQVALIETFAQQAAIAIDNVRLFNETNEALDQQRASGEVLAAISSSISDTAPVFEKILQSCERLFAGRTVGVNLVGEDGLLRLGAYRGPGRAEFDKIWPAPVDDYTGTGKAILTHRIVEIVDAQNQEDLSERIRHACTAIGIRGVIFAPMLWEGKGIGAIFVGRNFVAPFSEKEIALLKTFADQAVIAIQNARLFNETKEALEQQTAIAEILRVISSSPTDVQPVLDAIAEWAARFCDASAASMYLTDGNVLRHLASKGPSPDPVSHVEALPIDPNSISGRALLERRTIQVEDMHSIGADYPLSFDLAHRLGHRTVVVLPLYREGQPVGTILLRRQEVRPFNEREIALLQTFGDQAAIALENVRLFNETKEALEQQRASGEVLAAISGSIADTRPVFDKIIESCERLFAGRIVGINVVGDDGMNRLVGYHGPGKEEIEKTFPAPVDESTGTGLAILRKDVVQFPDIANDNDVPRITQRRCQAMGVAAVAIAPMLWDGRGIGAIFVGRDYAGLLSPKDVSLLKTFADQAAIAIQNARLFNETREALEQQRASGEVLAAISSSIADTTPVFDRILASCERLFFGKIGQINVVEEDGMVHMAAYNGANREEVEKHFPFPLDASSATGLAIATRSVMHYPYIYADPGVPPRARAGWKSEGVHAAIVAPMMWEGKGVGAVLVGR